MTAISGGQPGHIAMTATVGSLPHSKPTMVTQTGASSTEFEEFTQPELDIQKEQQTEANEEFKLQQTKKFEIWRNNQTET